MHSYTCVGFGKCVYVCEDICYRAIKARGQAAAGRSWSDAGRAGLKGDEGCSQLKEIYIRYIVATFNKSQRKK